MSFSLILQNNVSPLNKIGKTLLKKDTLTGELRNETDIVNPEILVEADISAFENCNYITIPEYGRSYYIQEIESVRNGILLLKLHVDVLESFKTKILDNTCVVLRQQNKFNLLLNDGVFKCQQNPRIFYRDFPYGLGQFNYILIAQGVDD